MDNDHARKLEPFPSHAWHGSSCRWPPVVLFAILGRNPACLICVTRTTRGLRLELEHAVPRAA